MKKNHQISNGHPTNGFATRTNGNTKLLVSFTNVDGSKHYFCSSSLGGGEANRLCTLPGCHKASHNSPCNCYISDALNGVICYSNGKDVYVLNPATGDVLTLPRADSVKGYVENDSIVNLPYSVYAFGFDPSKQEYKVLHVFGIRNGPGSALLYNQLVEVFTVRIKRNDDDEKPKEEKKVEEEKKRKGEKKGEENGGEKKDEGDIWRKAVSLPPCPYMFRSQAVCVNGAIHWLGVSSPGEETVVSFDLETEKFRFIPVPFPIPHRPVLSQVRGRLAIQGIEEVAGSGHILGVWILDDYKEMKWNKNTVEIANPKKQLGVKFYSLVGNDSTGDMVVMRSVLSERYDVVCLSGNKKTVAERTIRIGGFPSWVDLQRGRNLNIRIDNFVETKVALDPIVVKVEEEEKVADDVKEDGADQVKQQAPTVAKSSGKASVKAKAAATNYGRGQPPPQGHLSRAAA